MIKSLSVTKEVTYFDCNQQNIMTGFEVTTRFLMVVIIPT